MGSGCAHVTLSDHVVLPWTGGILCDDQLWMDITSGVMLSAIDGTTCKCFLFNKHGCICNKLLLFNLHYMSWYLTFASFNLVQGLLLCMHGQLMVQCLTTVVHVTNFSKLAWIKWIWNLKFCECFLFISSEFRAYQEILKDVRP